MGTAAARQLIGESAATAAVDSVAGSGAARQVIGESAVMAAEVVCRGADNASDVTSQSHSVWSAHVAPSRSPSWNRPIGSGCQPAVRAPSSTRDPSVPASCTTNNSAPLSGVGGGFTPAPSGLVHLSMSCWPLARYKIAGAARKRQRPIGEPLGNDQHHADDCPPGLHPCTLPAQTGAAAPSLLIDTQVREKDVDLGPRHGSAKVVMDAERGR